MWGGGKRDPYIDWCRAIAFILVVLHHSGMGKLGKNILGFHMPVFFIITGFTFKTIHIECRSIKEFFIKHLKQLVVPYVVFEVINYGLTKIFELFINDKFRTPAVPAIKSIFLVINNNEYVGISLRLWFLPCMSIASIIFVIALHVLRKIKCVGIEFLILFVSLASSYFVTKFAGCRLPFTIDISLLAVFYISLGYIVKKKIYIIRNVGYYNKFLIFIITIIIPELFMNK